MESQPDNAPVKSKFAQAEEEAQRLPPPTKPPVSITTFVRQCKKGEVIICDESKITIPQDGQYTLKVPNREGPVVRINKELLTIQDLYKTCSVMNRKQRRALGRR
jgi:hypothetical protein